MVQAIESRSFLAVHPTLRATTRVGWLPLDAARPTAREWLCLVLAAVAAASASTFLDFNLRMPGHAILRAVFPITAGLALVPRRGAGTVMGAIALVTALCYRLAGFTGEGLSLGAMTSLTAIGPMLDWTLSRTRGGWKLYLACAFAGLAANTLAFVVRATAKIVGFEHAGGRPLGSWLSTAFFTYTACGFVAGLVSAAIWFYGRQGGRKPRDGGQ